MDLVHPAIDRYLHAFALGGAGGDDAVLGEMQRKGEERSFPIVGPQVGRLLEVVARSIGARRVLELGSGFGYSAFWFARAVGEGGRVTLTEGSAEQAAEAKDHLARAGFADRVRIEVGDALELAPRAGEQDVVFNDVDKHSYPQAFEVARPLLRRGGLFLSDNMLWRGSVLEPRSADAATRGVLDLTRRLQEATDFLTVILPVRDGVSVSLKLV
jgi:caffeoyl-CoA O-methyltransferase